ncbi:SMI1/KNR4 family protein [Chelatococcus reniformis]|uniref:Cell wall assembly protein n=1 Tax=Chelatococcus reniformis TaxID=1494448 RepID=A0A916UC69_9HYPH|nr:SMI1/KNR4 family protein [Chelatococcus reniformis]GGC68275.1 cell wall assembly protein [Chelatococcus reniformis]
MPFPLDPVSPLKRIEGWLVRNHPDRLPLFRHGTDDRTLQRVEAKLGKSLPQEVRFLYAAHDGQPEGAPALYLNQRWLPLDVAAVAWEDLCLQHGAKGAPAGSPASSCDAAKRTFWSAEWLPIFGSPPGDHYCLDLGRQRTQGYGQILWFLYDHPERAVVAPGIAQLLTRVADGLEVGRWHLDDGYDGFSD